MYSTLWQHLRLLPKLLELRLHGCALTPVEIAPLCNLQRLQRLHLWLDYYPGAQESGPRRLLSALQYLTQLQHLELTDCGLGRIQPQQQQAGHAVYPCFSALTASTQLTALVINAYQGMPVPKQAFAYIFPDKRVLPDLKVLSLYCSWGPACVEAAQIARIAASCPALQELKLQDVTPWGFDTSCLAQLPLGVTSVEGLGWTRLAV
jgi:hypothetical protein